MSILSALFSQHFLDALIAPKCGVMVRSVSTKYELHSCQVVSWSVRGVAKPFLYSSACYLHDSCTIEYSAYVSAVGFTCEASFALLASSSNVKCPASVRGLLTALFHEPINDG